jgi:hypothetical protein
MSVLSQPETQPMWDSIVKPANFIPFQNAALELKLMPYKKKVDADHLVNLYGTGGMTATQKTAMILQINEESKEAVTWGRDQVQKK